MYHSSWQVRIARHALGPYHVIPAKQAGTACDLQKKKILVLRVGGHSYYKDFVWSLHHCACRWLLELQLGKSEYLCQQQEIPGVLMKLTTKTK